MKVQIQEIKEIMEELWGEDILTEKMHIIKDSYLIDETGAYNKACIDVLEALMLKMHDNGEVPDEIFDTDFFDN